MVASHYYIGCWQLEVTVLFALLWYFDKIHVLSSRPNYIKSKCRRFTYIDVLVVPPCLEVIYYMLLIQISIPSGFGTYDMPWSCSFWERVYQYRVSYMRTERTFFKMTRFDLMICAIYSTSQVKIQVTLSFQVKNLFTSCGVFYGYNLLS